MTSTVEITYLYNGFSLRINENIMNRAVRVKTAVKDKIKRVFEKNEVAVNNDVTAPVIEKESLIDLSHENLLNLNDILNRLEEQTGITHNANRAVLFTGPLVAKINKVTKKWFDGMPRVEKKIEIPVSTEMPSVNMSNHLGGEVVPGNWNYVPEKEVEETPVSLEPTLEAVPNIPVMDNIPLAEVTPVAEPEVSVPVESVSAVEPVVPAIEPQVNVPTVETQEQLVVNTVPQVEIPTVSENTDIYRFPSFEFNMESIAPKVQNTAVVSEENTSSFDFVPEPKSVDEVSKEEYVSEPVSLGEKTPAVENNVFTFEMPSFDYSFPSIDNEEVKQDTISDKIEEPIVAAPVSNNISEVEEKIGDLLNREFTPNPANNFVPEHIDNRPAEDKIDELLGRNKVVENTTVETAIEPIVTNVPEQKEEKPAITQGQIIARLRRVNNEMAEKDATIKSLTAKNDTLREEVSANKDKVAEYEVKVTDLTAKNTDLISQNERLTTKLEEVETNSRATISKLEAKVTELTQAKSDELESLRRQLEELKIRHTDEISSMREKHSAELKSVTESKDKQIQAIYSTISEALGETGEDYTRSMAA